MKWTKGINFLDDSPEYRPVGDYPLDARYCDDKDSPLRWHVIICREREREYAYGPKRYYWYAIITDCHKENAYTSERCTKVSTAKQWIESNIDNVKLN